MSTKTIMRVASVITLIMWGYVWANIMLNEGGIDGLTALVCIMAYPVVLYIQYKLYKSFDPLFLFLGDHKKYD